MHAFSLLRDPDFKGATGSRLRYIFMIAGKRETHGSNVPVFNHQKSVLADEAQPLMVFPPHVLSQTAIGDLGQPPAPPATELTCCALD